MSFSTSEACLAVANCSWSWICKSAMWTDFFCNSVQALQWVWRRVEGPPDRFEHVELPKYVLAIRGTILPHYKDIVDDIKIIGEVLHLAEKLHKPVKRLVQKIADKYGPQNIWVTGHSLGAAQTLIATRSLAIDHGIVINPYLFNPPYLTGRS